MRTILSNSIARHLYHFADAPGAAVADPPAGGGGATPSPEASEILDFNTPDLADINLGDTPPTPPAKPGAATATPPAKPTSPAPKKQDPPAKPAAGDPPAKQLREELDRTKGELTAAVKERDELKARVSADDPRLITANAEVEALKKENSATAAKMKEFETHAVMADPALSPEITKMNADYDARANSFYRAVPGTSLQMTNSLMGDYARVQALYGKPEYEQAMDDFEKKVSRTLGASEGETHKRTEKVVDWVRESYDFTVQRGAKMQEVKKNALQLARTRDLETYGGRVKHIDTLLSKAKELDPELQRTDPLHPKVSLAALDKELKPEDITKLDAGIPEFIKLVQAGLKPPTDDDYVGQTPEQIRASQEESLARFTKAQDHAVPVMYDGIRALRRLPLLMREIARLRAKVGETIEGDPGDPTKAGGDPTPGASDDDITKFQAPDLASLDIAG